MTEATFEAKGSKYIFTWPDFLLQAEVSRIHVNHERTICQLIFTTSHPNAHPHLLQTRFNLESSRSRSELAKDMGARYKIDSPIDWKNLLEYISVKALREYEKGDPVILISSTDEIAPLEYLIYPIAPLGKPTCIFGDPGSGKSQFLGVLNLICTLPWYDNPLKLIAPPNPTPVLFLDFEADPDDLRRQLKYLVNGMELARLELHYRHCSLPLEDDLEGIRSHLEDIKSSVIFVDSTSLAAGGDLNRMDVATGYIRALRQLNCTSISVAHTSKDRESSNKTIIGSVLFEAGFRSVWECRGQGDETTLDIALLHRKSNLSSKIHPLGYRFTYGESYTTIDWYDPKNVPEFVERMGTNQRVLDALRRGRKSTAELVEILEIKRNSVDQAVRRLSKAGKIVGDSQSWGLASNQSI